jgi:hypothetical protein
VGELLAAQGMAPFTRTNLEVLGSESPYGPHANADMQRTREAILRLSACHMDKAALQLLAREIAPAGTSWSPGTTGAGGRSRVSPLIRQYAFLLDKRRIAACVELDGAPIEIPAVQPIAEDRSSAPSPASTNLPVETVSGASVVVPLIRLAWARSGDKGDTSNIGVIARRPEWLPLLRAQLTPERVRSFLAHLVKGKVTRYEVPGIHAFNFVCKQALGGGGMASLRNDALGKGMGQILLSMPVQVPAAWLAHQNQEHR